MRRRMQGLTGTIAFTLTDSTMSCVLERAAVTRESLSALGVRQ